MSGGRERDGFYVGYLPEAPADVAGFVRRVVAVLLLLAAAVALALVLAEGPFGASDFEFGNVRRFEGIVSADPAPRLQVARPGRRGGRPRSSSFLLVRPGKHGARDLAGAHDGQHVSLSGTLVYRGGRTMIEVLPETLGTGGTASDTMRLDPPASGARDVGTFTLAGEIVDSKCFLGVMNPGNLKTHRACATRCISGGIPPLFLVRDRHGLAVELLLVDRGGRAVGERVLDMVAEPLRVTGRVVRHDDLLVLMADPADFSRIEDAGR